MNHPDQSTHSRVRRVLIYVSTIGAICGLVAVALATFLPPQNAASNGSLPPRLNAPQRMGAAGSAQPDKVAPPDKAPPSDQPILGESVQFDVSKPLRDIVLPPEKPVSVIREMGEPGETESGFDLQTNPVVNDPVVQRQFGPGITGQTTNAALAMPAPIVNFAGLTNIDGLYPPDTNGDVGPNNYVQWVNSHFQVFSKTGASVYGPAAGNTIWSGFGGPCETRNDGDPVVLYDAFADRWLMTQFTAANPYGECVAVSVSGDPTGAYYRYFFQFSTTIFYDYPKLGVWPDGYYLSANRFNGNTFAGASAIALNRGRMLSGQSATYQEFQTSTTYGTLLPADHDGLNPPPVGSPNFFAEIGATALHLWRFHVDWVTPANSTFTGPTALTVAAFTQLCAATRNCVPQNGTSQRVDGIGDRLMHRLVYRNFGDHETLAVNHTVDAGGGQAAVRWYEVRNPNGTATLYQQGTYAPDATHRWMGSLALDGSGNMALGYSVSSASIYPSIRYTGRLVTDTLGLLPQGETGIITGTGAQTGTGARWGDYSNMSIDPVDDCTFWYTQEYLATTGTAPWVTRVASFKFPSCTPASTGNLSGTVRNASNSNPISGAGVVAQSSIGATYNATTNGSGSYQIVSLPIGTYTVTASAGGYNASTVAGVIVTSGVTTTQNLSLTAASQADLSLIKTASATATAPTSVLGYTLTVTNNGPEAITATVTVTDVLPTGYALSTATGAGWICSGTAIVVCTRSSGLAVSASASINLVGLAPNAIGLITNTATVAASTYDPSPANNTSTVNVTLVPQTDLAVTKTGPAVAAPSTTLIYTINVSNNGPLAIGQATQMFTNTAGITINDNSAATPYPSLINVAGGGLVQKVTARIQGFAHSYPRDVDIILVGPTGAKSWLMSDPGGSSAVTNVNLTFDDAAAGTLSCSTGPTSGTYQPTDCTDTLGSDVFPAPAPTGPYAPSLAQFNGTDPAGLWRMYVGDDYNGDSGVMGSWGLTLLTGYAGPITVTDALPVGTTYVGAAGTGWSCAHASGTVTCTRSALALGAAPSIAITVTAPATTGLITNTVIVGSSLSDAAPANNTAQFTTNLVSGGSIYGVNVTPGAANQSALPGAVVTYTLAVTNTGNVSDIYTVLVSGNAFGATSPSNVGPLGAGAATTFHVVVTIPPATLGGTLDTANVKVTSQGDPSKFANASLTTTVAYSVYLPLVLRAP